MAVNLINSADIEITQTGDNIELNTSTSISTIQSNISTNATNIGNITGTILWTNPNPNQSMDATNISLSSSDYDVLEVFYKHFYSDDYILSQRTIKGAGTILLTNVAGSLARRQITQLDATTLSITAGDNTAAMVPVYVVGYKTGLFS